MTSPHPFNKNYSHKPPASTPDAKGAGGDSSAGWAAIISGVSQGAQAAMSSPDTGSAKKDAKERKRRTLANLLSQALQRKSKQHNASQAHLGEMKDLKSQVMQQQAKGFVHALQGSKKKK
jgi:hypothetical protein